MKIGRRWWHPTPVLLPGKSHEPRSLVGCSPWGHEESDMTEWLHFHFSLSCIGEENGNHSSVLAWRIPGTGELGGLPSTGSHRVGHDWSDLAAAAAAAAMKISFLFFFKSVYYFFGPPGNTPHFLKTSKTIWEISGVTWVYFCSIFFQSFL